MAISCLYYISYRVAVGHLCTNAIHQFYLNMPISCLYCTNYRVVVGHLGTNAIQQLYLNMHISCLYYIKLPRSGWSVGRAGLGAKATYPV